MRTFDCGLKANNSGNGFLIPKFELEHGYPWPCGLRLCWPSCLWHQCENPLAAPAQSLCSAVYEYGGIRSGEIGNAMFGRCENGTEIPSDMDLVRLAIPRRAYTQSHIDYVIEVLEYIHGLRGTLRGFRRGERGREDMAMYAILRDEWRR